MPISAGHGSIGLHWSRRCALLAWLLAASSYSHAWEECADAGATPHVQKLGEMPQHNYGRPGLSHMTIWGAKHHSMKELEVWLQTFAPGSGTPIHRHDCEEVFIVQAGEAAYLRAEVDGEKESGRPGPRVGSRAAANSTFRIPLNAVHQVRNLHPTEALTVLVIISKPPIRVYIYDTWDTPHDAATLSFPYPWDTVCPEDLRTQEQLDTREL
ncbi:auxin-binding protein [Klebsormidium nitens]|uniref:Auxin-binding protein n=1 Tax=Klebsormidium nitens TaxID=105231 RepID=A0A1Y1HYI8_KLENI|nr:auxin-binding protein [Klebsormidium nitens]|eukprot:GAQ82792.1 auxin-binding protein [Klebsormidium nitens]